MRQNPRFGMLLGNAIEHYDLSLYAYLAPFLAPAFFPTHDPTVGLLLIYLLVPIGFIARPLGAYLIGNIGDYVGRKRALVISIMGTGIATFTIGCLPPYTEIGVVAPLLLVVCRSFQSFFVGAEFNGGAICALEHTSPKRHGMISGLYCVGSVVGILAASLAAWLVSCYPALTWRFPFFLSFLTALIALYLRSTMTDLPLKESVSQAKISLTQLLSLYRIDFLRVIGVSGLFYTVYAIPSIFLNAYVPMISDVSLESMMLLSSVGLVIYMGSLATFGALSDIVSCEKIMKISALLILVLSYPLFFLLYDISITKILIFKGIFAILAGAFNGSFHAWVLPLFQYDHRYRGISLGYSLGSQLIGSSAPAICLWMWSQTHFVPAPAFYLMFCSFTGLACVSRVRMKQQVEAV